MQIVNPIDIEDALRIDLAEALTGTDVYAQPAPDNVSANSVLRKEMRTLCKKYRIKLFMPELRYCGDNAAMVGAQGYFEFLAGNLANRKLNAIASMDIDKK